MARYFLKLARARKSVSGPRVSDFRDRRSSSHLTIPDAAGLEDDDVASSDHTQPNSSASQPQMTMDPVTMRAGTPGKPPSSQQRVDAYLGKTLEGRYAIEALLGEGGMGFVYLGRHKLIDKRVAIKILRGDLAADQEMTERFLNEARAASSIGHPHIVDISDFGRLPDGAAYFAMEFLDGTSLSAVSGGGRVVALPRLVHIAKQIATGLSAAHQRGVVHRDLKPDNIMLIPRGNDRDFVKILDFGIAKLAGENAKLTRAGSVFGTPHYMSPEQAAGVPVDQRTDIYSLGVMIYEMATGRVPFDADNFMGILTQHMYKAPAPMRVVAMPGFDVPPGLEAIVVKALSKKPDLRYQTMDEVVADLDKLERGISPDAFGEITSRSAEFNIPADYFQNPQYAGRGSSKKTILWAVLLGEFVVLGVVGSFLAFTTRNRQPPPTATVAATTAEPEATPAIEVSSQPATAPKMSVAVGTDPLEALVTVEDDPADQGQLSPRALMIGPDEKVNIRVEKAGYETKRFTIDGKTINPKSPRASFKIPKEHVEPAAANGKSPAHVPARPAAPVSKPAPVASAPPPAPAPAPASTVRPAWCALDDWDSWSHKCLKPPK
jgi:serine/threonine-protein kinase